MISPVQESDTQAVAEEIDRLVDEYRVTCLWFLREDYKPGTDEQRLRALALIGQHGDRRGFQRARELRDWLLRLSKEKSACS